MITKKHRFEALRPLLIAVAAVAGLALGACQDDGEDDDGTSIWVEGACEDYCERAKDCDADVDEQECREDCIDAMGNCQADEQDAAVDQLQACAEEDCDDFLGCTIDAGAQCFFGL